MKLKFQERSIEQNKEAKRLRRNGKIPAIIYSDGKEGKSIAIESQEFQTALRQVKKGHLATTIFELKDDSGKTHKAIVKDIQYHPTTYTILHLDFEELHSDVYVNVKVPIECTGAADCQGIKLGGVLRQVIRALKVRCLPKNMPASFKVDIAHMGIKDSKRLKDLSLPDNVRPLADLNEVAVVIVKR